MLICRHRSPLAPGHQCRKRPLGRYCVEHWLERARWEWERRWILVRVDLSNVNRPYLTRDEEHRWPRWISLSYGNGNSDPVLSIDFGNVR